MTTQTDRTLSSLFARQTRTDGTTYVALTTTPETEWLRDAVFAAHDDEGPNDWRFETAWHIVAALEDGAERDEIADSLVDIYTHALLAWLSDNIGRIGYCDEAQNDGLTTDGADVMELITAGQFLCIDRMVHTLADAIAENVS